MLRRGGGSRTWAAAAVAALGLVIGVASAGAFSPTVESQNYSKGNERQAIYNTPAYQALLAQVGAQNRAAAMALQAADPEREFLTHLCSSGENGCAGDVRLYNWQTNGYGIVKPLLWTARNGATISGHVWATKAGPATRPGIVITNGSVQADEQLYWFVAQTLAKAGYVVLTWDPQGQGQSDTSGEAPDQGEGVPAQSDGRPFFDGTEDAINFFLSTPSHPYSPVVSCASGTSHAAKQIRRAASGLDAAYNPFWQLIDPGRIGIAGHSYGAAGVSYIGQSDPRVKTIVAFDNLAAPNPSSGTSEQPCPGDPSARSVPAVTKPALGMSADYFIPPVANASDPAPLAKSQESLAYTKARADTGELIIRGGTHYDFDWIPNAGFTATLRGADQIDWYTTAWFDKYLKGDPTADARLLTNGWRTDAAEASVDPNHDGNMFSFYYRSRLDIGLASGRRFTCEDLRAGCATVPSIAPCQGLVTNAAGPADYSYVAIDTTPDGAATNPTTPAGSGIYARAVAGCTAAGRRAATRCVDRRHYVVPLRFPHRGRVTLATVYVNGHRTTTVRGHALRRVVLRRLPLGTFTLRVVARTTRGGRVTTIRTYRGCGQTRRRDSASHRRRRAHGHVRTPGR